MKDVSKVIDIGSGYGQLLRVFRSQHPDLPLYATELDTKTQSYLAKYDIQCADVDDLDQSRIPKADLVVSCHVLEHFTDPDDFFQLCKKALHGDGYLFLEIPNCVFENGKYKDRPYDGPHLLFFTLKSLDHFLVKHGFEVLHIATSGVPYAIWLKGKTEVYQDLNKRGLKGKLRRFYRRLPPRFRSRIEKLRSNNIAATGTLDFLCYGGDRWTLRVMAVNRRALSS